MTHDLDAMPWLAPAWKGFAEAFAQKRLGHAYLLQSPPGMGKQALADAMQALLLCQQPENESPCGQCRSCQLLSGGAHPDRRVLTFEVNEKTNKLRTEIIVDQVRKLSASMQLTTAVSPRKLACIFPAEAMNRSAANSLLKTLEEPSGDAVLILICQDPRRLPATIRSRCQLISIRPPDNTVLLDWVMTRSGASGPDAQKALAACSNSPIGAVELLKTGELGSFDGLRSQLSGLLCGRSVLPQAMGVLGDHDATQMWSWLSGAASETLKAQLAGDRPEWLEKVPKIDLRALSDLQHRADRNRRLSATPVRQDFLLQSWLIEWSRLGQG